MNPSPDLPDRGPRSIPHEERLLSLIAANIRDMVVFVDLEGRIQWVNEAVVEQFGYTRDELIGAHVYTLQASGKNIPGIWSPGGTGELLEKWAGVIVARRRDGSEFTARVESFLVRDEHGSVTGIASISRDLTELTRNEEALAHKTMLLEANLQTSIDGILAVDSTGHTIFFNKRFGELWKIPPHILAGNDDARMLEHVVGQLKDPGEFTRRVAYLYEHKDEKSKDEIEFVDGRYFDRYSSPLLGAEGKHYGRIWYFHDITKRTRAEKALRESEAKYRLVVDNASEVIVVIQDGMLRLSNSSLVALLGFTEQELKSTPFPSFVHPDDRAMVMDRHQRRIRGEAVLTRYIFRLIAKDGSIRWIEAHAVQIDWEGRPATLGLLADITERTRAEEALRASRQIFEEIINAILVRVFWKDKNLVFLGCNAAFARDAGFADPKDIIGKDDYQMGWHDQAERYRSDDRQVIENGSSKSLIEEPQTTPEGNIITLLTSKIPLRDSKGEIIGVLGTYMDITERTRAKEALIASEKKYRDLFNDSNDAIFIANAKTRMLVDCNRKAEELTGYSRQEILAMRANQLHAEDAVGEAMEVFEKYAAGSRMPAMSEILTRDKKRRWVMISPATVTIGGEACVMGVFRDMTELKDHQRTLEERNRELEIISSAALTREFRIKELRDEIGALKRTIAGGGEGA